jgi:DNA-binding response OmpR family regulator
MVRHFAREHSCALAPRDIERIWRAGKRPVAHAKSCGIDVNSTYLPFTRNELGTEPAGTVTRWFPETSSTVKPPPSQPALAAANDRSTAVIVRSATAAAPKQSRPAANRARAITDFLVMRDDLKPRARFNLLKAGKCDGSIIGHSACSPAPIRLTKGLTVVTCERRCQAARRLSYVSVGQILLLRSRLLLGGMVKSESVRILVIEDEVKLATHLSRALEAEGHEARVVHDGKVALVEAREGDYDLLVLDVELPRMDGFEILKQLRSSGVPTRILMLTARSENPDKIAGLSGGADDYLTKPFAMNELLARVNALGRRFAVPPSRILRAGDVTLNVEKREVCRGERRIELSERECALLKVLMREPGRAFSRMELSERVWERAHEYDTKLIEIYIGRLRKKIDEGSSQPLIKTVRHLGYAVRGDSSA